MADEIVAPAADSFEAAFDEIVASMDAGAAAPVADEKPAPAAEKKPAPAAEEKPAPAAEEKPAPAAEEKSAPVAGEKPAPAAEEKSAPVAGEKPAPAAEEKPAPVAGEKPVPAPAVPAETPEEKAAREAFEASIAPYQPSEEEVAALAQFKKDFPNEALAVEARLKSVDRDINARVYKAVQSVLAQMEGRMAPVEQTVTASAVDAHWKALHSAHSDYDTVIAKVPEWIKTLPSYAQKGAQEVFDQGTTQEVIALVSDFKKATGVITAPTEPAAPTASVVKPKPAGADDLAPVSSRRAAVAPKGTPDPNDFNGSFADAIREMGL